MIKFLNPEFISLVEGIAESKCDLTQSFRSEIIVQKAVVPFVSVYILFETSIRFDQILTLCQ